MILFRRKHSVSGFTLAELIAIVVIISVLSSVVIVTSGSEWRRDRVNAVAVDFAG